MADYQPITCPKLKGKCNKFVLATCTNNQPHVPTMGKFPKFFISLDHAKFVDYSKIWIKLMHL